MRRAKQLREPPPPLLWVRCAVAHVEPTGGSHTVIGAKFLGPADPPKHDAAGGRDAAAPAAGPARTPARPPAPARPDPWGTEALFEQCPFGLALVTPDHRFRRVNAAFAATVGHPASALVGRAFEEITHPDDLAREAHLVGRVYAGESSHYELEKRYVSRDGRESRVRVTAFALRDERGRVGCAVKVVRPTVGGSVANDPPLAATGVTGDLQRQTELDELSRVVLG